MPASPIAQPNKKDLILIPPTASGKAATFLMPFLLEQDGIVLLVTRLKNLGEQQAGLREFRMLGIEATTVTGEKFSEDIFAGMKNGRYRLIITSPELLTGDGTRFEALFKSPSWINTIRRLIIDETHCLSR